MPHYASIYCRPERILGRSWRTAEEAPPLVGKMDEVHACGGSGLASVHSFSDQGWSGEVGDIGTSADWVYLTARSACVVFFPSFLVVCVCKRDAGVGEQERGDVVRRAALDDPQQIEQIALDVLVGWLVGWRDGPFRKPPSHRAASEALIVRVNSEETNDICAAVGEG
ncbi:hypothetical protein LY76DRAFT_595285 [Colletotrichum caudatum]|nr:hypothetical protein LY76DRAFT_595285 [Colletotrichum caudatum]